MPIITLDLMNCLNYWLIGWALLVDFVGSKIQMLTPSFIRLHANNDLDKIQNKEKNKANNKAKITPK